MPGVVGLITQKPRTWAEPQLLKMIGVLRHESFYVTGTWIDESLGVYVGWVARKNSFADRMPLCNEYGDVVLVFSGEEFPEPGTAARLKQNGHTFDPEGPSYLVHVYEDDTSFPAGLNGRFHGLLVDRKAGTAMLFNDRYAMHRMYYHESKEGMYFAGEAKAILAVRHELRSIEPRSLGEFVSCGCVLEDRTLFKDVCVLPGASIWKFRGGVLEKKSTYFQPREWEQQPKLLPKPYYLQLRETFSRNLPRYFNEREPIAMSLTGGLDTRTVIAWRRPEPGSLPCYSFGGTYRDSQDVILARRIAHECGQTHQVIRADGAFLSQFPRLAERTVYLSDGCADVSRSPVLYMNEQAAKIAPIRMTGNYGDEVLRRVRMFKHVRPAAGLFRPEFFAQVDLAKQTYTDLLKCNPLSFTVFRQAPWHNYGLLSLEQTQLGIRSPFLDNDLVRTVFRAPESVFANNDVRVQLIGDGNPVLRRIRTDLGFAGNSGRLFARASQSYLRFTFRAEYAYNYGMPQWLARIDHALAPLRLDRLFLGRHKYYHFRVWYRDALAGYIREMLLDSRTLSRPYLGRKTLEAVVRGHLKGDQNYTTE